MGKHWMSSAASVKKGSKYCVTAWWSKGKQHPTKEKRAVPLPVKARAPQLLNTQPKGRYEYYSRKKRSRQVFFKETER